MKEILISYELGTLPEEYTTSYCEFQCGSCPKAVANLPIGRVMCEDFSDGGIILSINIMASIKGTDFISLGVATSKIRPSSKSTTITALLLKSKGHSLDLKVKVNYQLVTSSISEMLPHVNNTIALCFQTQFFNVPFEELPYRIIDHQGTCLSTGSIDHPDIPSFALLRQEFSHSFLEISLAGVNLGVLTSPIQLDTPMVLKIPIHPKGTLLVTVSVVSIGEGKVISLPRLSIPNFINDLLINGLPITDNKCVQLVAYIEDISHSMALAKGANTDPDIEDNMVAESRLKAIYTGFTSPVTNRNELPGKALGKYIFPMLADVTKHDMDVSTERQGKTNDGGQISTNAYTPINLQGIFQNTSFSKGRRRSSIKKGHADTGRSENNGSIGYDTSVSGDGGNTGKAGAPVVLSITLVLMDLADPNTYAVDVVAVGYITETGRSVVNTITNTKDPPPASSPTGMLALMPEVHECTLNGSLKFTSKYSVTTMNGISNTLNSVSSSSISLSTSVIVTNISDINQKIINALKNEPNVTDIKESDEKKASAPVIAVIDSPQGAVSITANEVNMTKSSSGKKLAQDDKSGNNIDYSINSSNNDKDSDIEVEAKLTSSSSDGNTEKLKIEDEKILHSADKPSKASQKMKLSSKTNGDEGDDYTSVMAGTPPTAMASTLSASNSANKLESKMNQNIVDTALQGAKNAPLMAASPTTTNSLYAMNTQPIAPSYNSNITSSGSVPANSVNKNTRSNNENVSYVNGHNSNAAGGYMELVQSDLRDKQRMIDRLMNENQDRNEELLKANEIISNVQQEIVKLKIQITQQQAAISYQNQYNQNISNITQDLLRDKYNIDDISLNTNKQTLLDIVNDLSKQLYTINEERLELKRNRDMVALNMKKYDELNRNYMELQDAHVMQAKYVQKMQNKLSKIKVYESTIQTQEKVINKMQGLIESHLRSQYSSIHNNLNQSSSQVGGSNSNGISNGNNVKKTSNRNSSNMLQVPSVDEEERNESAEMAPSASSSKMLLEELQTKQLLIDELKDKSSSFEAQLISKTMRIDALQAQLIASSRESSKEISVLKTRILEYEMNSRASTANHSEDSRFDNDNVSESNKQKRSNRQQNGYGNVEQDDDSSQMDYDDESEAEMGRKLNSLLENRSNNSFEVRNVDVSNRNSKELMVRNKAENESPLYKFPQQQQQQQQQQQIYNQPQRDRIGNLSSKESARSNASKHSNQDQNIGAFVNDRGANEPSHLHRQNIITANSSNNNNNSKYQRAGEDSSSLSLPKSYSGIHESSNLNRNQPSLGVVYGADREDLYSRRPSGNLVPSNASYISKSRPGSTSSVLSDSLETLLVKDPSSNVTLSKTKFVGSDKVPSLQLKGSK